MALKVTIKYYECLIYELMNNKLLILGLITLISISLSFAGLDLTTGEYLAWHVIQHDGPFSYFDVIKPDRVTKGINEFQLVPKYYIKEVEVITYPLREECHDVFDDNGSPIGKNCIMVEDTKNPIITTTYKDFQYSLDDINAELSKIGNSLSSKVSITSLDEGAGLIDAKSEVNAFDGESIILNVINPSKAKLRIGDQSIVVISNTTTQYNISNGLINLVLTNGTFQEIWAYNNSLSDYSRITKLYDVVNWAGGGTTTQQGWNNIKIMEDTIDKTIIQVNYSDVETNNYTLVNYTISTGNSFWIQDFKLVTGIGTVFYVAIWYQPGDWLEYVYFSNRTVSNYTIEVPRQTFYPSSIATQVSYGGNVTLIQGFTTKNRTEGYSADTHQDIYNYDDELTRTAIKGVLMDIDTSTNTDKNFTGERTSYDSSQMIQSTYDDFGDLYNSDLWTGSPIIADLGDGTSNMSTGDILSIYVNRSTHFNVTWRVNFVNYSNQGYDATLSVGLPGGAPPYTNFIIFTYAGAAGDGYVQGRCFNSSAQGGLIDGLAGTYLDTIEDGTVDNDWLNRWHNITLMWENDTYANWYVDGIFVGACNSTSNPTYVPDTSESNAISIIANVDTINISLHIDWIKVDTDGLPDTLDGDDSATFWNVTQDASFAETFANLSLKPLESIDRSNVGEVNDYQNYWRLDETSGSTAYDSGSNLNNFTLANTTDDAWVSGRFGNAVYFNGSIGSLNGSQYAYTTSLAEFADDTTGTVSLWAKLTNVSGSSSQSYLAFGRNAIAKNTRFRMLFQQTIDNLLIDLSADSVISFWTISLRDFSNKIQISNWTHIIVVHDGIAPKVYLNGIEMEINISGSAINKTKWFDVLLSATDPIDVLSIGAYKRGGDIWSGLNGTIDDVRIYDRPLTSEEVWGLYSSAISDTNNQLNISETWTWESNIPNDFGVTPKYWACFPNGTHYWSVNAYLELPNYYGTTYGNISSTSKSPFNYNTTISFTNTSWIQSIGNINLSYQPVNTTITLTSDYELNLSIVNWEITPFKGGYGNFTYGNLRVPGTSWNSGQNTTVAACYYDWINETVHNWAENATYSHNLTHQGIKRKVNGTNTGRDFTDVNFSVSLPVNETVCDYCTDTMNVNVGDFEWNASDTGDWINETIQAWEENNSYSHNLSSQGLLRLINGTNPDYNFTDVNWTVSLPTNETVCDYCTDLRGFYIGDFAFNASDTGDWINETIHNWEENKSYQQNMTHQGIVRLVNGTANYNFTDVPWEVSLLYGEAVCDYCTGTRNINNTFEWNASDTGDWLTETTGTDWQQYVTETTYAGGLAWIHGKGRASNSLNISFTNVAYNNTSASAMCRSGWTCTITGIQYIPSIPASGTGTDDTREVVSNKTNVITKKPEIQAQNLTIIVGPRARFEAKINGTNTDTLVGYDNVNVTFTEIPAEAVMESGNGTSVLFDVVASGTYIAVTNYTMPAVNEIIGSLVLGAIEINKEVNYSRQVFWDNTAAITYYNVTGQLTIPTSTNPSTINITTDTEVITPQEVNASERYFKWNKSSMTAGQEIGFNVTYNTTAPNITTSFIVNLTHYTKYVNLSGPVEPIYANVKVYTSVNESIVIPYLYKKISGVWIDVTTNKNYNVLKEDTNGNGRTDRITWYEPSLNQSSEFYITALVGDPILTQCKNEARNWENCSLSVAGDCPKQHIRTKIGVSEAVYWKYECRFYNPNIVTRSITDKFRISPEATNILYDEVGEELLWDLYGPYISIEDENIQPRSYNHHNITFYTPPVFAELAYHYQEEFYVNELADVNITIRLTNYASENITVDIYKDIRIGYGEEIKLLDEDNKTITDYGLEQGTLSVNLGTILAGETKDFRLNYKTPTATYNLPRPAYKLRFNNTEFNVQEAEVTSIAYVPLTELLWEYEEKDCNLVDYVAKVNEYTERLIIDVNTIEFTCEEIDEVETLVITLGVLDVGESIKIKIYKRAVITPITIPGLEEMSKAIIDFFTNIWMFFWQLIIGIF